MAVSPITTTLACTLGRKRNVSIDFFVIQNWKLWSVHTSFATVSMSQCGCQVAVSWRHRNSVCLLLNDCYHGELMNFECFLKLMSEFDILSYCSHHLLFSGLVKGRGCQDQLERQVIDGKKFMPSSCFCITLSGNSQRRGDQGDHFGHSKQPWSTWPLATHSERQAEHKPLKQVLNKQSGMETVCGFLKVRPMASRDWLLLRITRYRERRGGGDTFRWR